jgi:integrase
VNERNNQPQPFPFGKGTLAALVEMCRERIRPLLKNSTRISYDFFLDTHILPKWGSVLLAKQDIRRVIDALPEPTKSIVTLMVVGSLRIGEVTALRWERIQPDRIEIVERFYEGEFDDTKTDAGRRSIPFDSHGILRAVLDATWQRSKYRKPDDLVFTNKEGGPVNRRNLLRRHLKPTVKKLGLPATVDFPSFRTVHSSLMSSAGVRPGVTRDNMGHSTVDVMQNVYNRTWWEERVEAVSLAAASVWREFTPGRQPCAVNVNPLCKPS